MNEGVFVGVVRTGRAVGVLVRGWVRGCVGVLPAALAPRLVRRFVSNPSVPNRRARNSRVDMPAERVGVERGVKMPDELCATDRVVACCVRRVVPRERLERLRKVGVVQLPLRLVVGRVVRVRVARAREGCALRVLALRVRDRLGARNERPEVRPRDTRMPRERPELPFASDSLASTAKAMNAMHATLRMSEPPCAILGREHEEGGTRLRAPPVCMSIKEDSRG
ncbi:MAG: hypothetical protein ACYTHK_04925 [Planctomycetota bacterium]|jgi:hypothetical protein